MKFDLMDFEGQWLESIGKPERNFKAVVYGASGNGKTDFCVKFSKYLSAFGKVLYLSHEEGISSTIQEAFERNKMMDVKGDVILADKGTVEQLAEYLAKKNSPKFVFIDSLDYMRLTTDQYKYITSRFPKKSFVIVAWARGEKPKSQYAKDIEYMCDIKIRVSNYVANIKSRYGGNKPFVIWPERVIGKNDDEKDTKNTLQRGG